ncbi:carbonic anhydrase-domain-containing protein [Mycena sp. CBHHK59/15]|nr:carbonic anhydrase-domain-containing protein [Mycena sp. CBHHK59/15]
MILECADNRVTAGTILHATLGTIFGHHNLGNLYSQNDTNANAALVYGVEELGVKHIIVMGHYGCPTVGTALMGNSTAVSKSKKKSGEEPNSTHNHSAPEVDAWIQPIRQLYLSSNRTEIVALRDNKTALTEVPDASNLGFRALVEENVKASVARIRKDSILAKIYQTQAGSSSSVVVSSTKVSSSGASSATFVESTGASSSTIEKSAKPSGSVSSSKAKSAAPPSKSVSPRAKAKSASAQPSSSIMYSSVKPSAASGFAASPTPTGHTTDGQDQIDVFVHGFVYDMETGDVFNLGVTFGPPGRILPKVPFSAVASATQALKSAHSASNTVSASATH